MGDGEGVSEGETVSVPVQDAVSTTLWVALSVGVLGRLREQLVERVGVWLTLPLVPVEKLSEELRDGERVTDHVKLVVRKMLDVLETEGDGRVQLWLPVGDRCQERVKVSVLVWVCVGLRLSGAVMLGLLESVEVQLTLSVAVAETDKVLVAVGGEQVTV